jgi:hypothetical protein
VFVVDTNILVYAADRNAEHHDSCRTRVDAWRRSAGAWYVTWSICYEFLRVVTHRAVLRSPWSVTAATDFVDALLAAPGLAVLRPTERHRDVLREVVELVPHARGNLIHDLHIAVLMREHGIRTIQTRDTAFHRFDFVDVVDPVD